MKKLLPILIVVVLVAVYAFADQLKNDQNKSQTINTTHRGVTITGSADEAQLTVTGNSTQTSQLQVWEISDGTDVGLMSSGGYLQVLTLSASGASTFGSVATAGELKGNRDVDAISATTTLTNAQVRNTLLMVSAACTIYLPAVSSCGVGASVTVFSDGANILEVAANAVDRIKLNGTDLTDGDDTDNDDAEADGDFITLVADSADGWTSLDSSGTWTDGGAT